jgi:hypothetical protein
MSAMFGVHVTILCISHQLDSSCRAQADHNSSCLQASARVSEFVYTVCVVHVYVARGIGFLSLHG